MRTRTCLVDDQHVEHDIVLVDGHYGLGVHGVGEARQLRHLRQLAALLGYSSSTT